MDWAAGYVTEVGYTYDYWPELNPLRVRFALSTAGLAAPEIQTACELGFGQGISIAIHAAASGTQWYGNDFNPVHAEFAQTLARCSGASARLCDQSFAEFAQRDDLPEFDFIGLHGVWTWVSEENRSIIVDFIRRKLKSGGIAYVSYNTQPGWATMLPLRHLLSRHATVMSSAGQGVVGRIDLAIAFVDRLLAADPIYAKYNPSVLEYFKSLKAQERHYLAHEYFNRDFDPMYFADVAERLSSAKLNFACAAHFLDHLDAANVNAAQQVLLHEIPDPYFRESVRDFCVNQRFRRDYWVKGARKLTPQEQADALSQQRVILVQPRNDVSLKFMWTVGEVSLREETFRPVLDALSDHRPRTLAQIVQAIGNKNYTLGHAGMAVVVFLGTGALQLVQDEKAAAKAKRQTDRLNMVFMEHARVGRTMKPIFASPLTGGVEVERFHALFLLARSKGERQPADWARFVWEVLVAEGEKVVKDGRRLETSEENLSELNVLAKGFATNQLPIFQALGIA